MEQGTSVVEEWWGGQAMTRAEVMALREGPDGDMAVALALNRGADYPLRFTTCRYAAHWLMAELDLRGLRKAFVINLCEMLGGHRWREDALNASLDWGQAACLMKADPLMISKAALLATYGL